MVKNAKIRSSDGMTPPDSSPAEPLQPGFVAAQQAAECLLQGLLTITARQAELSQQFLVESLNQWLELSHAGGPDALLQGEMAMLRAQTERSVTMLRSFNDDVRQCCFDAFGAVVAIITPPPIAAGKTGGS